MKDGLVKRGSKWSYVLRVPDLISGRTKQKWIGGFASEKEARSARDKARVSVNAGIYVSPSKITVGEFLRKWMDIHALRLKPSTETGYRENLERYTIPRLGKIPLGMV
jgi:integrase